MGLLNTLGLKPTKAMLGKTGQAQATKAAGPAQKGDAGDASANAEPLKKKIGEQLHKRLDNLKSNLDQAVKRAGAGADAVRRRLADAERLLEEAIKSGLKEAVDKAHRAIDVVQMAVDDALADGDEQARQERLAQQQQKDIERLRDEVLGQLDKIHNPDARAKLQGVLKALDADMKTALGQADARKRLQALQALAGKAEKAAQLAAQLASAKAPPKGDAMKSPEMQTLIARFQQVMATIRTLEADKLPQSAALKKAAIAAGNLSTSPKGIVQANAALDQVEAQIEDAKGERDDALAAKDAASAGATLDVDKLVAQARQRLKALEMRGRKAIAADPRNTNGGWLTEVVAGSEGRIADLQERGTKAESDGLRKHLDWLEEGIVRFEEDAKSAAQDKRNSPPEGKAASDDSDSAAKPPAEESPELKKVKAHFKRVMAAVKKLADAKVAQAAALKKAAIAAGNLASSPKGIVQAEKALDQVSNDIAKAKAAAEKAKADADQAAAQTFDLSVGGRKLVGVHRDAALGALKFEENKLNTQLESGWAFHIDQMNLPNEVPFQAWLTTGVDAVKSFFKGVDAAKMPDLNIWDAPRDMLIEVHQAEKKGDVQTIAALLPKIAQAIQQARAKVGNYDEQMQGSAQTGVDAGRFVEDSAASALGALAEKEGGKAGKVAMQAAAQGTFQGVEQLTEWLIGSRQMADWGAIARKAGEEAVGAILKELLVGALKGPFKSAFGSYIGKGVDDLTLKALGLSRDAFMTAAQKFLAEFAAKQGAGLIKAAISKLIAGKLPSSPGDLADAVAAELAKGSAKQLVVEGVKLLASAAVQ